MLLKKSITQTAVLQLTDLETSVSFERTREVIDLGKAIKPVCRDFLAVTDQRAILFNEYSIDDEIETFLCNNTLARIYIVNGVAPTNSPPIIHATTLSPEEHDFAIARFPYLETTYGCL